MIILDGQSTADCWILVGLQYILLSLELDVDVKLTRAMHVMFDTYHAQTSSRRMSSSPFEFCIPLSIGKYVFQQSSEPAIAAPNASQPHAHHSQHHGTNIFFACALCRFGGDSSLECFCSDVWSEGYVSGAVKQRPS